MGYCRQIALPTTEPVSVEEAKSFLYLPSNSSGQDDFILGSIQAAREMAEILTNRALAKRQFVMVLDSHPYYTDTIGSQLAYPPSYYSLPRFSTTLWNYSQMIKLPFSPVISVDAMASVAPDGSITTMNQDVDFVLDRISEPARIFPLPGRFWPPDLYVANALQITFTAGYTADPAATDSHTSTGTNQQTTSKIVSGVPQLIRMGILNLVAYWFQNRGASDVPPAIEKLFLSQAVIDFAPIRG